MHAALVEEIYLAQRERDQAVMARLRLANEERDEALLRAKRLQQAAAEYVQYHTYTLTHTHSNTHTHRAQHPTTLLLSLCQLHTSGSFVWRIWPYRTFLVNNISGLFLSLSDTLSLFLHCLVRLCQFIFPCLPLSLRESEQADTAAAKFPTGKNVYLKYKYKFTYI